MNNEPLWTSKITWNEFRDTGLTVFINIILHIFGLAIAYEIDDNGNVKDVYPVRCKYRGFSEDIMGKAYGKLSEYMLYSAKDLHADTKL